MSESNPPKRKSVKYLKAPISSRTTIESRLEVIGNTIHTPQAWYKEDVYRLLMYCDALYTEVMALRNQED